MSDSLLTHYRNLERTSEQMLRAAQQDDWAEVRRLEALCTEQVTQLKSHQRSGAPLTPPAKAQKHRLMLAILRHDAQIRSLAEPGLGGLELLFFRQGPGMLH